LATPAEKPVASRVNDLSLQTALKAAPGSKGLVRRVTNLGSLHVYDGRDFVGTVQRIGNRFTATTPTGKRVGVFETLTTAARALPVTTTTIQNEQARHLAEGAGPNRRSVCSPDNLCPGRPPGKRLTAPGP
jgi:hypothetical protein